MVPFHRLDVADVLLAEMRVVTLPGAVPHHPGRKTTPRIRVLNAGDHTLVRQPGEGMGGFAVVAEAANGAQVVALARTAQPGVILMGVVMPELDGASAIRWAGRARPGRRRAAPAVVRLAIRFG